MKTFGNRRKARILAFQGLYSWDITQCDPAELFEFSWSKEELSEEVRTFACLVIKGTIENLPEIDEKIKQSLRKWDFERLERVNLAILRISIYALLYQKDIPHRVTIDEAVEIIKEFGTADSFRFVNGVLDNIKKQIDG
jgi:transcription antitermination protein NusB